VINRAHFEQNLPAKSLTADDRKTVGGILAQERSS